MLKDEGRRQKGVPRVLRVLMVLLVLMAPPTCGAQPAAWPGRAVITFNAAAQATTTRFGDRFTFEQYLEQATVDTSYKVASAPLFDGGVTVRVWRNVGVGLAISRFADRGTAGVAAGVPHPFHFNRPRAVEGQAQRIQRTETGVHLLLAWMTPITRRVRFMFAAGPSWMNVEQSVVNAVRYTEEYPFDSATFTTAELERESRGAVGFNAGVDVIWVFSNNVGVGGLLRFARAKATVRPSGRDLDLDAGGLHAGGGIRILF